MADTIILAGNYGYKSYKISGSDADVIDASDATWIVANTGSQINLYPFYVLDADPGLDIIGGTINGQVSLTLDWTKAYINSAAVMVKDSLDVTIRDWRIDRAWDGIRVAGSSQGFEIENTWLSEIRDDAVENDTAVSGTIRDSLFDGVFSGISLGNKYTPDRTGNVVTIDNLLLRMEDYLAEGEVTHVAPFKMVANSPKLRIFDSVIAIEDIDHLGYGRLALAWDKTIESSGNVFLNLSDQRLPSGYPLPGKGWTILQGEAARDYWESARSAWIARHEAGGGTPEPQPTPPPPNPEPVPGGLVGTDSADVLTGTSGADTMSGRGGDDRLHGKNGNDTLTGGLGNDAFVFDTRPSGSSNLDVVTDFAPGTDRIYLDNAIFSRLGSGSISSPRALSEAFFEVAGRADDQNDHVMYKWKTGALYYDADGSGGGSAVQFAQLAARLDLDHSDFFVV